MTAPLSSTARLLGFAGLLPQIAFVGLQFVHPDPGWTLLAFAYGALILSFLGGIWWGMAVARRGPDAGLLALSVAPTLVGMALLVGVLLQTTIRWPLVLLGSAIMLTLLVDRHLMNRGDAPPDWMRLRTPLSLGLGALEGNRMALPSEVALVVEIAETTASRDRGMKRLAYARAAIPTYWVVDGKRELTHVYSEPRDGDYAQVDTVRFGQPLAVPGTDATITIN